MKIGHAVKIVDHARKIAGAPLAALVCNHVGAGELRRGGGRLDGDAAAAARERASGRRRFRFRAICCTLMQHRADAVHVDMTRAASVEMSEHAPSERDLGADLAPDDGDDEEAAAAASFSVIIESLVPVRGHVLEASAAETVLSLKQRYLALLRTEARALEAAEAARPSAGGAAAAGAAGAPALRSRPSFANDGRVDEGYELSVSLILDGYELVDARTLESYAVADGARICVVSRRSRSGVGWRLLNEVWRWWPLLGGLALISVLYAEAFGWVPGDDVARCDTPLTPFLACVGPIFVPYGIVFSGVYPGPRKRLLWFVKARVLNATVAVAALFALGGLVVGAVWLFDGASTCRDDAPQLYYAALLAWLLLVALNTPWLVLLSRAAPAALPRAALLPHRRADERGRTARRWSGAITFGKRAEAAASARLDW